jgi:hypothetical protein
MVETEPQKPPPLGPAPAEPAPALVEPGGPEVLPASVRVLRKVGGTLLGIPRRWACVPLIAWAGLIYFMSSRPAPTLGGVGALGGVLENFGHALEYGVFAVWFALAAPRRAGWVHLGPRSFSAILLAVLLYAASDEWHQAFTPHRDSSAFDVLTDFVGASATLACIAAIGRQRGAGKALGIRFALGLLACLLAATLAAHGPKLLATWTRA